MVSHGTRVIVVHCIVKLVELVYFTVGKCDRISIEFSSTARSIRSNGITVTVNQMDSMIVWIRSTAHSTQLASLAML